MKKVLKSMAVSLLLVLTLVTAAFANSVNDIRSQLIADGVPTNYVGNIIEYLQKTTITKSQYNKVMGYINQAESIIGNVDNIRELSSSDKNEVQNLAVKAANVLGLKASFSKNSQGYTTVTLTDANGGIIVQVSTLDVNSLVTMFNPSVIKECVKEMYNFSNNPQKGKYNPVSGELTQTATNYGNIMVLGAALVACAGFIFTYSKKQFA